MHAVMMESGRTFHSYCASIDCSKVYLLSLQVVASSRNMSLQYVNSKICL